MDTDCHDDIPLNVFVLQQQQNLGRRFGTSKMHFNPTRDLGCVVCSKAVVLLLLIRCLIEHYSHY